MYCQVGFRASFISGNKPDINRISANASVVGADRWDIPRHSRSHVDENVTKVHFNDVITHASQYIHSANEVGAQFFLLCLEMREMLPATPLKMGIYACKLLNV